MQGPRSSFQSAGADSPPLKCNWREGGCGVVDFKNGCPGVDSIVFNTVTTHQSFFLNSLTNEKGVSSKKNVAMHSSIMIFAYFIYFKSLSVFSLRLCLEPFIGHC